MASEDEAHDRELGIETNEGTDRSALIAAAGERGSCRDDRGAGDERSSDCPPSATPVEYWSNCRGLSGLLAGAVRWLAVRRHAPFFAVIAILLTFGASIGLGLTTLLTHPVRINTSLRSFEAFDMRISRRQEAFEHALAVSPPHKQHNLARDFPQSTRFRRADHSQRTDLGERSFDGMQVELIFLAKDGGGVFRKHILERIHRIERAIEAYEDYTKFCRLLNPYKSGPFPAPLSGCAPLNSLMTYFYRWNGRTVRMAYGGNISKALENAIAIAGRTFVWYIDSSASEPVESTFVRARMIMGWPLHGFWGWSSAQHALTSDYVVGLAPYFDRLSDG